jgi:hypothetical protein
MDHRFERRDRGENSPVGVNGDDKKRIVLLAARQPDLEELLADAGFEVDSRRRPLDGDVPAADVAVVFRGRLLGRNQATILHRRGIPVIEVLTSEPMSPSTRSWLRLSNRIPKSDLVQIVRSVADGAQ